MNTYLGISSELGPQDVSDEVAGDTDYLFLEGYLYDKPKGKQAFVLVVEKDVARRRPVAFGGFDGDDALITGLPPQTRVITAGAGFVGDGEKVQVVDPTRLEVASAGAAR